VAAVRNISTLSRKVIRERFEQRFTSRRMALDYVAAYQTVRDAQRRQDKPRPRLVS
jgi:hypothetical protein